MKIDIYFKLPKKQCHAILSPMSTVSSVLPYIQIALSVIVIASVLLQQSGAANGSALGGADMSSAFHTRRGLEKILFVTTIVASILFAVTSFLGLVL